MGVIVCTEPRIATSTSKDGVAKAVCVGLVTFIPYAAQTYVVIICVESRERGVYSAYTLARRSTAYRTSDVIGIPAICASGTDRHDAEERVSCRTICSGLSTHHDPDAFVLTTTVHGNAVNRAIAVSV